MPILRILWSELPIWHCIPGIKSWMKSVNKVQTYLCKYINICTEKLCIEICLNLFCTGLNISPQNTPSSWTSPVYHPANPHLLWFPPCETPVGTLVLWTEPWWCRGAALQRCVSGHCCLPTQPGGPSSPTHTQTDKLTMCHYITAVSHKAMRSLITYTHTDRQINTVSLHHCCLPHSQEVPHYLHTDRQSNNVLQMYYITTVSQYKSLSTGSPSSSIHRQIDKAEWLSLFWVWNVWYHL